MAPVGAVGEERSGRAALLLAPAVPMSPLPAAPRTPKAKWQQLGCMLTLQGVGARMRCRDLRALPPPLPLPITLCLWVGSGWGGAGLGLHPLHAPHLETISDAYGKPYGKLRPF